MTIDWDKQVVGPTTGVFGGPVVYRPAAGGSFQVTGVFDHANHDVVLLDDGATATTNQPILGIQLSQFPAPPLQGDTLTIVSTGDTYVVRDIQNDSHGGASLALTAASLPS